MSDQAPGDQPRGPSPSTRGPSHALEAQIRRAGDRALARLAQELRAASEGKCDVREGRAQVPSASEPSDSSEAASAEIRLSAEDVAKIRALIQPALRKAPPSGGADQDLLDSLGY